MTFGFAGDPERFGRIRPHWVSPANRRGAREDGGPVAARRIPPDGCGALPLVHVPGVVAEANRVHLPVPGTIRASEVNGRTHSQALEVARVRIRERRNVRERPLWSLGRTWFTSRCQAPEVNEGTGRRSSSIHAERLAPQGEPRVRRPVDCYEGEHVSADCGNSSRLPVYIGGPCRGRPAARQRR